MKRLALLVVATVVVGGIAFLVARRASVHAQTGARKAFTAIYIDSGYKPDWTLALRQAGIYAVRGDGSTVEAQSEELPNHEWVTVRSVVDLAARKRTSVSPETESISTYALSDAALAHYQRPDTSCSAQSSAPHATILGYDTVQVHSEITHPPGIVLKSDRWLAPALDCYPLRVRSFFGSTGGPPSPNFREVVAVMEGEPSPALFAIPEGYTERSPSEANAEYMKRFPGKTQFPESTGRKLDEIYERTHQPQ